MSLAICPKIFWTYSFKNRKKISKKKWRLFFALHFLKNVKRGLFYSIFTKLVYFSNIFPNCPYIPQVVLIDAHHSNKNTAKIKHRPRKFQLVCCFFYLNFLTVTFFKEIDNFQQINGKKRSRKNCAGYEPVYRGTSINTLDFLDNVQLK